MRHKSAHYLTHVMAFVHTLTHTRTHAHTHAHTRVPIHANLRVLKRNRRVYKYTGCAAYVQHLINREETSSNVLPRSFESHYSVSGTRLVDPVSPVEDPESSGRWAKEHDI